MKEVIVKSEQLSRAAAEGSDAFLRVVTDAVKAAAGELTVESMASLNTAQLTLLAYDVLREEVMDGGFVQLIYNGYGAFIFDNPFARVVKLWEMKELSKLVYAARKLYLEYHEEIERECSDEEFMAMFERFPKFDDLDDEFVENEEAWSEAMAYYVDEHLGDFVKVEE